MHDTYLAKSYDVSDPRQVPTIDGKPVPWWVSAEVRPMVEAIADGAMHILWLPVLIDAPMPSPPEGRPDAQPATPEESA